MSRSVSGESDLDAPTEKSNRWILVIDDSADVRRIFSLLAQFDGFEVVACADGAEGLRALAKDCHDWAAIYLDLTMPVMNGFEVLNEIHRVYPRFSIPIVVMTGLERLSQLHESVRGVLAKPFSLDELRRSLHEFLPEQARPTSR